MKKIIFSIFIVLFLNLSLVNSYSESMNMLNIKLGFGDSSFLNSLFVIIIALIILIMALIAIIIIRFLKFKYLI